jgi:hypothetical protein
MEYGATQKRTTAACYARLTAACQHSENTLYFSAMSSLRQANALTLLASLLLAGLLLRVAR